MENKEIIKRMKDFVEELENKESEINTTKDLVPSFADISKEELRGVLGLSRTGKIDLKDYWNVGDTKEYNGCKYVIIDIGYDRFVNYSEFEKNTVTIMRTDLVNLDVSLKDAGDLCRYEHFNDTILGKQVRQFPEFFTGRFFDGLVARAQKFDYILAPSVFLPSKEEIFDEEKAYEYFKNPENRKLGNSWWSRSGFLRSDGYARFVFCDSDGSQSIGGPANSRGLAPCFVI